MNAAEVTQIKIGKYTFGFVGLHAALKEVSEGHAQAPEGEIIEELLRRISAKNYIPENVRDTYGRAFLREYRKYRGEPYSDDAPAGGLEIKILGGGCNMCDGLENEVMELLAEMGLSADLEHVRDPTEIARFGATGTPALLINGKVVSVGSIPPKKQIREWIGAVNPSTPGIAMEKKKFIKNIPFSEPQRLANLVDYAEGRVVSRTFAQNSTLSITLFAFDTGEEISTHTAPGDAMVQVLDGEAAVTIAGRELSLSAGQVVVMPADVPHSVKAVKRFKMLLTVVK
jgi:quercetin dioxygenase-like cupin family protein